jgi:hypothetical protein
MRPGEGKRLVLAATDVVRSNYVVCPVWGTETFIDINPGVSASFRESSVKARSAGVSFNFEFTIGFRSGSTLEVICQGLEVDVQD